MYQFALRMRAIFSRVFAFETEVAIRRDTQPKPPEDNLKVEDKRKKTKGKLATTLALGLLLTPLLNSKAHSNVQANAMNAPLTDTEIRIGALMWVLTDSDQRAALFLHDDFELSYAQVGSILGMDEETAANRIGRAHDVLIQKLNASVGRRAQSPERRLMSFDEQDHAVMQRLVGAMYAVTLSELTKEAPSTASTVTFNELVQKPAMSGIRVVGTGANVLTVAPLVVTIPAGVLPKGGWLSISEPIVLTAGLDIQPMVVTDAYPLLLKDDGSSVWLLKANCLKKSAKAPTPGDRFGWNGEAQSLLTPPIRSILRQGGSNVQGDLWREQSRAFRSRLLAPSSFIRGEMTGRSLKEAA